MLRQMQRINLEDILADIASSSSVLLKDRLTIQIRNRDREEKTSQVIRNIPRILAMVIDTLL